MIMEFATPTALLVAALISLLWFVKGNAEQQEKMRNAAKELDELRKIEKDEIKRLKVLNNKIENIFNKKENDQ